MLSGHFSWKLVFRYKWDLLIPVQKGFDVEVLLCCSVLHLCGDHRPYYGAEPLHPTREVSSVSLMQSLHRRNPGPQEICSVPTELNNNNKKKSFSLQLPRS